MAPVITFVRDYDNESMAVFYGTEYLLGGEYEIDALKLLQTLEQFQLLPDGVKVEQAQTYGNAGDYFE